MGSATTSANENSWEELYKHLTNNLFDKCFKLTWNFIEKQPNENILENLAAIESNLNALKVQIPSDQIKKWRRHTSMTNPTRGMSLRLWHAYELEYCTRAFCKLFEILLRFDSLIPNEIISDKCFRSLHLCEAPGAFISALNSYLLLYRAGIRKQWSWYGNSLNPHYEWHEPSSLFLDDELITDTYPHWLFGPDNSGDVLMWDDAYISYLRASIGTFDLITADGSVYCQDNPSQQELATLPVINAEVNIALRLLVEGGSLIIKMYTFYCKETLSLIENLLNVFGSLHFLKPSCSKPGNSEDILACAQFFAALQKEMLLFNLSTFPYSEEPSFVNNLTFQRFLRQKQSDIIKIFESRLVTFRLKEMKSDFWLRACKNEKEAFGFHAPERANPWRFRELHGQVESLRNIPSSVAFCELNKMMLRACLTGEFDSPKRSFYVKLCNSCHSCCWLQNSKDLLCGKAKIFVFGRRRCDGSGVRQSLFADLRTIVHLNVAKMHFVDFCENDNVSAALVDKCGLIATEMPLRTQIDWINLLEEVCKDQDSIQEIRLNMKMALIVTRFTASFFMILALIFENVSLELSTESRVSLTCYERQNELTCKLLPYLQNLQDWSLQPSEFPATNRQIMQFVPVHQFRCNKFYQAIREYNSAAIMRILSQQLYTNQEL